MTIRGLVMDPTSNTPVVMLENPDGNLLLPIWIGVCEANSIALELEGVAIPRPMTHDLIRDLLSTAGCVVDHIFIHSLEDNVFMASIQLRDANAVVHAVDSRPSDAIAIAFRAKVDVLVDPGGPRARRPQRIHGRRNDSRTVGKDAPGRHGRVRNVITAGRSPPWMGSLHWKPRQPVVSAELSR